MNTYQEPLFRTVVERLFLEARSSDSKVRERLARSELSVEAWKDLAKTNYREAYALFDQSFLAVSPETATLLYMLARASRARAIVEFGTSFGLSTLHLAAALKDNGGGVLVGSEFEPSKVLAARENLRAAGLSQCVEVREGDALQTLARDLPAEIGLVLLDGAKVLYPKVLDLLEPRLVPGALVIADNAESCPEYLERVRSSGSKYLSLRFGEDVEVSQFLAG